MWINVLVYNSKRKVTGITGTGVELNDFVVSMYRTLEKGVTMYMYNTNAEISASTDLNDLERKSSVDAVGDSMQVIFENVQNIAKNGMELDGCVEDLNTNVTKLVSDVSRFKTA